MKTASVLFLAATLSIKISAQQPGDLDMSFDSDGKVTTAITTKWDEVRAIAVQPDGKIIAAGFSENSSDYDITLTHYNTNGSLDNTFGLNGKVITDFNNGDEQAYAIALQSDGKILIAGKVGIFSVGLVRYNANGSLDTGFGNGGLISTNFNPINEKAAVALQSDGKIILGGTDYSGAYTNFGLVRFHTNGDPDSTFGTNGILIASLSASHDDLACITIQPDGKIVAAGATFNGSNRDYSLARFNSNGTFDTGFNGTGKITLPIGTLDDYVHSVIVQPDGKILITGTTDKTPLDQDFGLLRFNSDGSIDNSFGTGGKVTTSIGSLQDQAHSAVLQSDGKIVIAGCSNNTSNYDIAVVRYNTNGTLDNTFSGDGKLTTTIGTGDDYALAVAIQPDGRIVAAGYTANGTDREFTLARYYSGLSAGISDILAIQNILAYPNPVERVLTLEYSLTKDENLNILLCDVAGRLVTTFIHGENKNKGLHYETLNLEAIPPGTYVLTLAGNNEKASLLISKQ